MCVRFPGGRTLVGGDAARARAFHSWLPAANGPQSYRIAHSVQPSRRSYSGSSRGGFHLNFNLVNALIAANVAAFAGAFYLSDMDPYTWVPWINRHMYLSNQRISRGQYDTLLLSSFMHVDLAHLVMNMLALHSFGGITLYFLGNARFAALYITGAVVGAGAQAAYFRYVPQMRWPASSYLKWDSTSCGASAAIAALVAYTSAVSPKSEVLLFFVLPMQMRHFLLGFLSLSGYCMYSGLFLQLGHAAHVGGALAGLAFFAATRGRGPIRWR